MMKTGSVVVLVVAKQGAIFHGLATLLSQPSPAVTRGEPDCKFMIVFLYLQSYSIVCFLRFPNSTVSFRSSHCQSITVSNSI